MTHDFLGQNWLTNTLFDAAYLQQKCADLALKRPPEWIENWLSQHFDADVLKACNEAQLENRFIAPLLEQLNWFKVTQESFTVQGKVAKPDWCLVLDKEAASDLITSKDHALITAICESKAWSKPLDTGKAHRENNPHHQLQDYLSTLRVRFGFLTNGRIWRLYDTDRVTAKKTYFELDLQKIVALTNTVERAFALNMFVLFFCRNSYQKPETADRLSLLMQMIEESRAYTLAVEENLKAVIYGYAGEDSIFETLGKALTKANPKASLADVYENAIVLLFRLLFVVYFEDKNRAVLDAHPFYQEHSSEQLFHALRKPPEKRQANQAKYFDGIYALKHLFSLLNEGAADIEVPLFNGGLFDPDRAPLLLAPRLLDNATLCQILEKLYFKTHRGNTLFDTRRDFKSMSVTHLGRIYEGLLEFRFERAQEDAVYLEYESIATKGNTIEAYFDKYDITEIRSQKGFRPLREIQVKKGEIFLKSASNSRKTSASYYTEPALSQPLVKASIDYAIDPALGKRKLTELKILDNACGSGHFLVESLGYLTDLALVQLENDTTLQELLSQERSKIEEQFAALNLDYEPEDAQILKRLLLKRCIFGVDLNPFAVELARLSLWMDSFIFGTPLSFIEHHIQHGNSLMGASVQDFIDYNAIEVAQNDLFVEDLGARFDDLRSVMHELDAMRDTTAVEVEQSKALWKNSIAPKLQLLSRALSFVCTGRAMQAEGNERAWEALKKTPDIITQLFDETRTTNNTKSAALKQVEAYAERYRFFHFEVSFPEAFAKFSNGQRGFDIIIGNPPWDKTKFSDTDFFPQYHSNYRSMKNAEKLAVQKRLLGSKHIKVEYEKTQKEAEYANNYYKAAYPLNRGAGDGNLFRFFVERNLGLLAKGGTLNYVLPSALMFEEGSLTLRQHLFTHCHLRFFYSYENRKRIFMDVDSRYKFAQMQLVHRPPQTAAEEVIDSAFYVLDPEELRSPTRHITYPLAMLKALSPDQWAMMELRSAVDLAILQKCYCAYTALSESWLNFRSELHMTNDKSLFLEKETSGLLPLFEGKMFWQYDHKHASPQYWLNSAAFDARMTSKELYRMAQDLNVRKAEAAKHAEAIRFDREFIRLGFRDIASDTNERTLVFSLIPKNCGAGNTINICVPKTYVRSEEGVVSVQAVSPLRLLFALAWFNSLPVDWMARFMIQIHANKTYLYRLPMPQPTDEEIRNTPDFAQLAKNALLLSLAASWDDFAELAPLFGVQPQDVPQIAKDIDKLRAQNDQIVARLYGISEGEFAHVVESFKVMASKRPKYLTLLQ